MTQITDHNTKGLRPEVLALELSDAEKQQMVDLTKMARSFSGPARATLVKASGLLSSAVHMAQMQAMALYVVAQKYGPGPESEDGSAHNTEIPETMRQAILETFAQDDDSEGVLSYRTAVSLIQNSQKREAALNGDQDFEPPHPAEWITFAVMEAHKRGRRAESEFVPAGLSVFQESKYTTDGTHIVNRSTGETIPIEEPIMILRGKDPFAALVISLYIDMISNAEHRQAMIRVFMRFMKFRALYQQRMAAEPTTDLSETSED